jgi:hypothetical protein
MKRTYSFFINLFRNDFDPPQCVEYLVEARNLSGNRIKIMQLVDEEGDEHSPTEEETKIIIKCAKKTRRSLQKALHTANACL